MSGHGSARCHENEARAERAEQHSKALRDGLLWALEQLPPRCRSPICGSCQPVMAKVEELKKLLTK